MPTFYRIKELKALYTTKYFQLNSPQISTSLIPFIQKAFPSENFAEEKQELLARGESLARKVERKKSWSWSYLRIEQYFLLELSVQVHPRKVLKSLSSKV